MKKLHGATTKLEKTVQRTLNQKAYDGYSIESVLQDLMHGGCESGFIRELIYYTDTVKFYKKHKTEILSLLKNMLMDCGYKSPSELFGDKWDDEDVFAEEQFNQNLLAWFGFEETARILADRNGIEV